MATAPFDASKAVTFDLALGEIRLEHAARRMLVAADAIVKLCEAAGAEAVTSFGHALGESIGQRVARGIGGSVRDASLEAVVEHLSGEWALAGLGSLGIERWGRALVVVVDHGPGGADGDRLVEPTLASAMSRAAGTELRSVLLARDGARARFLVTGALGAEKVRTWIGSGVSWAEALVRLHPGRSEQGGKA
jgi:hypothetical protein